MVRRTLLSIAFFCAFASPASAQWINITAGLEANATLTKLAENDYEFAANWGFAEWWLPSAIFNSIPRASGYGEYPYTRYADLQGMPSGVYYQGPMGGGQGYFKSYNPPTDPMSLVASSEIEVTFPDGPVDLVGTLSGNVTLYGDVPTEIGQSTSWSAVPEPATLLLLSLGFTMILLQNRRALMKDSPLGALK